MLRRASGCLERSTRCHPVLAQHPVSSSLAAAPSCQRHHSCAAHPVSSSAARRGTLQERIRNAVSGPGYQRSTLITTRSISSSPSLGFFSQHDTAYFSSSRPDPPDESIPDERPLDTPNPVRLSIDSFRPEPLDPPSFLLEPHLQSLFQALQDRDAEHAWQEFKLLEAEGSLLAPEIIDSLLSILAQGPSYATDPEALEQVCQKLLYLRDHKANYSPQGLDSDKGEPGPTPASYDEKLRLLRHEHALRLCSLLTYRAEQHFLSESNIESGETKEDNGATAAALVSTAPHIKDITRILNDIEAIVSLKNADYGAELETSIPLTLRAQVGVCLAKLGEIHMAAPQLAHLLRDAQRLGKAEELDPATFDMVLYHSAKSIAEEPADRTLPSPADDPNAPGGNTAVLLELIRITLAADVGPSKGALHKALDTLDRETLWDLLPFQRELFESESQGTEMRFIPRWHHWMQEIDGISVSEESIQMLGERIALVLARGGELAPALYIIEMCESAIGESGQDTYNHAPDVVPIDRVPDPDLFTTAIATLARRIRSTGKIHRSTSDDAHRAVKADLLAGLRIYPAARKIGVRVDPIFHDLMVSNFSILLRSSITKLGDFDAKRRRKDSTRSQLARKMENKGEGTSFQLLLRRYTTAVLTEDPDLRDDSLGLRAHATLLGLHMKVRDYSFSKRLYQLFRVREPSRDLWREEPGSDSLYFLSLDRAAAPDRSSFGWFFLESIRASTGMYFAVRLYLDWVASGNKLSPDMIGLLVPALLKDGLKDVTQRILRDMHEQRIQIPRHLAETFVASFADAGFPEVSISMATVLSDISERHRLRQRSSSLRDSEQAETEHTVSTETLLSTIKIYSVALDRASKSSVPWSSPRKAHILRLFDDYRLALAHVMREHVGEDNRWTQHGANTPSGFLSISSVRLAYNAAIRTHLEVRGLGEEDDLPHNAVVDLDFPHFGGQDGTALSFLDMEITRRKVVKLVNEMKDLGVDPDHNTWGMLIGSDLGFGSIRGSFETRKKHLLRAVQTFMESIEATFLEDGVLGPGQESFDAHLRVEKLRKKAAVTGPKRNKIQIKSGIVGRLIVNLARASMFEAAQRIYKIWKMRQLLRYGLDGPLSRKAGWDKGIEGARIYLLACKGKQIEWRRELDVLVQGGFKVSRGMLRRLERISGAQQLQDK